MSSTATVTFPGIGSGIDVQSLVTGLVNAEKGNLTQMQNQSAAAKQAATALSSVGTSLSALRSAAQAIASVQDVASFSATSSNTSAVVASAMGSAQAGSYDVSVLDTAKEQRTYSGAFASSGDALGQTGTLTIGVGGTTKSIAIASGDSLAAIASKINGAGLRMNASVFYDGTSYRLQVRGLDTGAANALTLTESGTVLGLDPNTSPTAFAPGQGGTTVQAATDAKVSIDGFTVTRPTNQISGIIPGVTLAVTQKTTSPVTINVAPDPATLTSKVQAVVTAFNQVVNTVHSLAGYGTTKASVASLAGDSALRQIAQRLSDTIGQAQLGQGPLATLAQLGLEKTRDGTLQLDTTKLQTALTNDPASVEAILGRAQGAASGGAMANLADLVNQLTAVGTGTLATRTQYFNDQAKKLGDDATKEQSRLDDYATRLQQQFTAMDTAVAQNQVLLNQLSKL